MQAISALQPIEGDEALHGIAEDDDKTGIGNQRLDAGTRLGRSKVRGRDFTHREVPRVFREVVEVPVDSTLEVQIEKPGFLCRARQECPRIEHIVKPRCSASWRSQYHESG